MSKLEELLESEEGKQELESYFSKRVAESGYKAPDEVEGLVKKKDELLSKVASLNRDKTSEEQRAILAMLEDAGVSSVDDIQRAFKKDTPDYERQMNRLKQQYEEASAKYESERNARLSSEKDNAIIRALKEARIKESAFNMAFAYFDKLAEIEEVDGKVNVLAKDQAGLGPSMDSFIKEWAKSEAAIDYVEKPLNRGAGVTGANGVENKTVYTRAELSDPKVARKVMERKKAGEEITIE